jgi:hypothetical protein
MTEKLSLRRDDLAWRTVDDELVAIDVRGSTYLTANGSGLALWAALAEGATRDELVAVLTESYDVAAETAAADVDAFLAALEERELLDAGRPAA